MVGVAHAILEAGVLAVSLSLACHQNGAETAAAERTVEEIQRSHVEANVPDRSEFNRLLRRDLEAYFATGSGVGTAVAFEFLREGPTQTGIAFPKYYLWVRVAGGTRAEERGAVRVAAVEKEKFEVTDFLSEEDIRNDPSSIERVFPAPVCERIRAKLQVAGR